MVDVALESVICIGDDFFFLLSVTGNHASFSMSYNTLMRSVYTFCSGLRNCIVDDVASSGYFKLDREVMIDVRAVRYCTYVEFLERPIFFRKIKVHVCRV